MEPTGIHIVVQYNKVASFSLIYLLLKYNSTLLFVLSSSKINQIDVVHEILQFYYSTVDINRL